MNNSDKIPDDKNDDLSTRAHRQVIGGIGMALPVLLYLIAGLRPTAENPWAPLGSVSAYYYTGAVSAFAGMLITLALFLFSYHGYQNRYYVRDRIAAIIAGSAAVLVAFFPTDAPSKTPPLAWWTHRTGTIHLVSAAVLFSSFVFFCLFQFPMSSVDKASLTWDKKLRNGIYIFCGVAITLSMLWVVKALSIGAPIFLPEVLALEFFAISWLVKGRVDQTMIAAGKYSIHYARHPQELVQKVSSAMRGQQDTKPKSNS